MEQISASDPLAEVHRSLAELSAEDRAGWSAEAQSARVRELAEVVERFQAELARAVAAWDASRAWEADGALSARSWLTHHTATARVEASALVRTARLVHSHERTRKALAARDVCYAHVALLARAARHRTDLYREDEDVLVDAAEALSPDGLAVAVRRWRELADEELARRESAELHERRHLHLSPTFGGAVPIEGLLDAAGGAIVAAALAARDRPDAVGSELAPRTAAQRRADALVEICEQSLANAECEGRQSPAAELVIDYDTLVGRHAALDRLRCDVDGVGPVPRDVVERLLCDSTVGRIVMRGKSEVIDVGRRTRVVSPALRRAIVARDRGCVFPGCDAPAAWCDVHHLVHWSRGGHTNEVNCVLLCTRHHTVVHIGGWQLTRGPDGRIAAERPGTLRRARSSLAATAPGHRPDPGDVDDTRTAVG